MFPIIGLGEPYIPRFGGVLQECGYFTWRVSESEELVGVNQRRLWGCFWRCYPFKCSPGRDIEREKIKKI